MKATKTDAEAVQKKPARQPRPSMRAPRPSVWEPIPLHIPLPQPEAPSTRTDSDTPRGVVIIQYGDET